MRANRWLATSVVISALVLSALAWLAWSARRPRVVDDALPVAAHGSASSAVEPSIVASAGSGLRIPATPSTGDGEGQEVVLRGDSLENDGLVRGVVLGPDGMPVQDAHVMFVRDDRGRPQMYTGRSGADGSFAIDVEQAGVRGDLVASMDEPEYSRAALRDIRSGSERVELRLGAPDFIRVEVRDPTGREPEIYGVSFSWLYAGHRLDGDEGLSRDHVHELPRPPVPFFVNVHAREHHARSFGPFEPTEVGAVLVVQVEPFARVRGVVRSGGEPVPKAEVQMRHALEPVIEFDLELRPRRWNGWSQARETDDAGRFDLALEKSGRYELRAWRIPEGEGSVGPLELDGSRGAEGLEIVIDRAPGAVEGRVTLPPGRRSAEIWLAVAERGFRSLGSDGSYRLPNLPPGRYMVRFADGDELQRPGDHWIPVGWRAMRAPDWLPVEPSFGVDVRSGETTRLDIDLAVPLACQLEGRFLIDGNAPEPSELDLIRAIEASGPGVILDRGEHATFVGATDLDPWGHFVLGVAEPGTYRLRIEQVNLAVLDRVTLAPGVVPWRHDIPVGSLRVLPADDARPFESPSLLARCASPGDLRIFARRPELDEETGALTFERVPAGTIQLVVDETEGRRTLLECQVRAGKTTEVRLPR